jgi:hypothetical protein
VITASLDCPFPEFPMPEGKVEMWWKAYGDRPLSEAALAEALTTGRPLTSTKLATATCAMRARSVLAEALRVLTKAE